MDLTIYDLIESAVDKFINQDSDIYARIVREPSTFDQTVDLLINVRTVAIDDNHIIIEYPNGAVAAINIPSCNYLKIEVM
jgi:hypothetical protein